MNLKALRLSRNETQAEIAELIGITRAAYTNIENDKREPDIETLIILANHFDVSIDYLLGREEQQKKPTVVDDGLSEKERIQNALLNLPLEEQLEILKSVFVAATERKDTTMKPNTPATRFKTALDAAGFSEQQFAQICGLDPYDVRLILSGLALPGERMLNVLSLSVPTAKTDISGEWSHESLYDDFKKADIKTKKRMFDVNGVPMSLYADYLALSGIEKAPDVINIERHNGKFQKINPPKQDEAPQA